MVHGNNIISSTTIKALAGMIPQLTPFEMTVNTEETVHTGIFMHIHWEQEIERERR